MSLSSPDEVSDDAANYFVRYFYLHVRHDSPGAIRNACPTASPFGRPTTQNAEADLRRIIAELSRENASLKAEIARLQKQPAVWKPATDDAATKPVPKTIPTLPIKFARG